MLVRKQKFIYELLNDLNLPSSLHGFSQSLLIKNSNEFLIQL